MCDTRLLFCDDVRSTGLTQLGLTFCEASADKDGQVRAPRMDHAEDALSQSGLVIGHDNEARPVQTGQLQGTAAAVVPTEDAVPLGLGAARAVGTQCENK